MAEFEDRMAALRVRFRERVDSDLNVLRRALDEKDSDTIRTTSHGLVGTAGIFGFSNIGDAAARLEEAIDAGETWTAITDHCEILIAELGPA